MENLKELLIQLSFKNNKFSNNMLRSKNNQNLRNLMKEKTLFLPENCSDSQRAWHIYNNTYTYILCSGGHQRKKFISFEQGYLKTCHLPRFQCSCWDDAKKSSSDTMKKTNQSGKIKQSIQEKYGVDHVSHISEVREKIYSNKKEKGFEWSSKMKKTMIERYGVETTLQSPELKEKVKQTCLEKYGSENVMQCEEVKKKVKETCLKKYGAPNFNQIHCNEILNSINSKEIWDQFKTIQEANAEFNSYLGVDTIRRYAWRFRPDLIGKGTVISSPHQRVIDLLILHNIEFDVNTRSIISPMELDIYIPSKQLAIEVNGIYWHSELSGGKDRNYHLNKTIACEKKGIRLLQFWDIEIENKWDIVSSMILNRLGLISNSIFARKCSFISEVNTEDEIEFFEKNHIQGYVQSSICIGLFYNNSFVSMMSFRTPRYNNKFSYELLRYANKIDTSIVGGASKLFSKRPEGSIISYADRRFSIGSIYKTLGMAKSVSSSPSYHYTQDYITQSHRSKYRKKQLPKRLNNFNPDLTEWENMKVNGFDRIWDCGTYVFITNPKSVSCYLS